MLQRWTDSSMEKNTPVLDDYERNVTLVDLTAQPSEIMTMLMILLLNTQLQKINKWLAHTL